MENTIRLTQQELFLSLKSTVLGVSSPHHVWDFVSERFVPVGTTYNAKKGVLLIDGKDEIVSNRLVVSPTLITQTHKSQFDSSFLKDRHVTTSSRNFVINPTNEVAPYISQ